MLVWLGLCGGCAPVTGTVQIVNAELALAEAEDVGAPRYATYEYTMAREYLRKAREAQGCSDFQASRRFSRKARRYAESALQQSESFLERSEKPMVVRAVEAKPDACVNTPEPSPAEPVQEAPGETP